MTGILKIAGRGLKFRAVDVHVPKVAPRRVGPARE
jgi:hypothetical protein